MKIVTDTSMDIAPEQISDLSIEAVPLKITLDGKEYRAGVDIQSDEFYRLVRASDDYPTTSQPSPEEFFEAYSRLSADDNEILSIHISAGISGTFNSARLGAERITKESDGKQVTVYDTRTTSGALGWCVEAAARVAKAGGTVEQALALVERIAKATRIVFSPEDLKYLVHGGRVSHLQGFAASLLNIKPVLQIHFDEGKPVSHSRARTMKKAIAAHVDIIAGELGEGERVRFQLIHADSPEPAEFAEGLLKQRFDCTFLPSTSITPLIGAHLGPGAIGIVYAPQSIFDEMP